ncbi:MAG: amino acid adenylation domain-containing protein [Clostridia bacterium]|nr:amino acid adenylation domain-containing protein [Clostridia bacterium]
MSDNNIFSERKSMLSPEKLAILEKLKHSKVKVNAAAIPKRKQEERIPLSFAQQRLWFLDQLVPNSPAYNVVMALHLSGNIREEIFEQSINEIVRRHEVLRTTFESDNGQPFQVISPELILKLPVIDMTVYPESEREAEFGQLAKEEAKYIFSLSQGPLLRVTLFNMGNQKYILLVNVHHIVIDGWSILSVFFKELVTHYIAFSKGEQSPLPELPIQYADFSIWQRQWLQGEVLESQLDYWREKLGGEKNAFELPLDHTRPPVQTFKGGNFKFRLPTSLTKSLKSLSEQQNATLYMVMLGALNILLHRYSGQEEVLVGSPIANRNRTEIENLIGFFANTLVYKTNLSGDPSFLELLGRVREVANGAYMHQDVPFELLVEDLQPERNMSQNPLFQVCFVLQNFQKFQIPTNEFDIAYEGGEEIRNDTSKFDLWIQLVEKDDMLDGEVEYNSDIFSESTIMRMLESYEILLAGIVSNPEQRISGLPILSEKEKEKLLFDWNDTAINYPQQNLCLHELVESQAAFTPDFPAVIFENTKLTYKELDQRANQLANYLRRMGVGPEVLVGISVERSIEMVIGLLGILKAGGAYVPLDPAYPRERLAFMMADAQVPLLLTQKHLYADLPEHGAKVVCLDSDWDIISKESRVGTASGAVSNNLAYVIYTSGSTGKPKGAMNTHRGIVNRLLWMQQQYQLDTSDRILQKTPFSFDVSVWEFFWPLATGACMVLAKPEGHKDPAYLARLIKSENITTVHFVPSMLQVFLEEKEIEGCNSLKRVICSGEALSLSLQEYFFERLHAELHNLYGPTEAAIDVTFWACSQKDGLRTVPIGRPVANTQIYLLDKYLNPVPVGVPGELHIGGVQLARGYYRRQELTDERFIPNLFSTEQGTRLYRTGDLARYMPDGNIEFLGRIDFQVKVRGFRIELPEIEAVLEQYPTVQKAVVLARDNEYIPGQKQLVAYVNPALHVQEEVEGLTGEELPYVQVSEWEKVFDEAYDTSEHQKDEGFNISSWNSSYTGLPLSMEEMREWVDSTVERILALKPRNVLEIGCGTGLLLSRIAPSCEQYWGTDISAAAVDYVTDHLLERRGDLSHVKLLRKNADDFSGLEGKKFDVVVMNSVVQYFPGIEYLSGVIRNAAELIAHTGYIFIGDIRSLPLLEAFHTDVELAKAQDSLTIKQLRHRTQKRMHQENELVIDPEFFLALQSETPQISHVEFQIKRGCHLNEMSIYRYDVILHIGKKVQHVMDFPWLDWQNEMLDLDRLRQTLVSSRTDILGITNVPNKRLGSINRCLKLLSDTRCPESVGELRQIINSCKDDTGVDPEELWDLCCELQYNASIAWANGCNDGRLQVILRRKQISGDNEDDMTIAIHPFSAPAGKQLECYANNPLLDRITRTLIPQLRSYLKEKLPDYMIPSAFMVLKEMPVDSNGKLDRKAFPAPLLEIPDMEEDYVEPVTQTEKILAEIWADVLGLERVGIKNNFFELGANSIQSIQVVARAKQKGIELTPQQIFQHQTIAGLAEIINMCLIEDDKQINPTDSNLTLHGKRLEIQLTEHDRARINGMLSEIQGIEDVYPLSAVQENMLFRRLNANDTGLYMVDTVYVIKGKEFNVSAFEKAWQNIVKKYPVLRTSFVWEGLDEPMQVVFRDVSIRMEQEDWTHIPLDIQKTHLEAYMNVFRKEDFKINGPVPQTRISLIKINEDEYYFIHAINLMVQDGWSYPVIMRNLLDFYEAYCEGRKIEVEPVSSYRNFIAWQRQQDLVKAERFWRENLDGVTVPTPLVQVINGHSTDEEAVMHAEWSVIPQELMEGLTVFTKQQHITMYTLVQAAWALQLARRSGKNDVVFGSVFSGRGTALAGIEDSVGQHFNILPVRVRIDLGAGLLPWLKELQGNGMEVISYEYTPIRKIYEWCGIARENLLFESYTVSEQIPQLSAAFKKFSQIGAGSIRALAQTDQPLRVEILPLDVGTCINMVYYKRCFDSKEISQMLKNMHILLKGFVDNPEQKLSEFMRLI